MKRVLLIIVTALLTLSSCWKETPAVEEGRTYALSSLRFEFIIDRVETKGIKTKWESGDKVFVFFSGVTNAYVTMSFDGTDWSSSSNGQVQLNKTGVLTAVYLPYVGNVQPAYSEGWHFASVSESYFLKAEKIEYYIQDTNHQIATLGARLPMTKANDESVQFYIDRVPEQNETMRLACNVVTPTGLAGIASDGTVTSSVGTQGAWMTGYPATVAGEQGFYFYGTIAETPGSNTYFAVKDNAGTYFRHYYKGNTTLLPRKSYQLPVLDNWAGVGSDVQVNVGGYLWYSLNDGASSPLDTGTASQAQPQAAGQKLIPSKTAWGGLLDSEKATLVPMIIGGVPGVLVVDKLIPSQCFFLTEGDYWSSASGFYFRVASDGTCSVETGTPESAYVRAILNVNSGSIIDPIGGGEI